MRLYGLSRQARSCATEADSLYLLLLRTASGISWRGWGGEYMRWEGYEAAVVEEKRWTLRQKFESHSVIFYLTRLCCKLYIAEGRPLPWRRMP